jgi:hypothetical protein
MPRYVLSSKIIPAEHILTELFRMTIMPAVEPVRERIRMHKLPSITASCALLSTIALHAQATDVLPFIANQSYVAEVDHCQTEEDLKSLLEFQANKGIDAATWEEKVRKGLCVRGNIETFTALSTVRNYYLEGTRLFVIRAEIRGAAVFINSARPVSEP